MLRKEADLISKEILDVMYPYVFETTKTTTEMLNIALTALSVRDDYTDEEDLISKTFSQVLDLYKVKEPL